MTPDDVSIVGRGTRIDGALTSTGSLQIHGKVTGEIVVDGDVSVAAGSEVQADIKARTVNLAGLLKGNLTAPGEVVLPAPSRIEGNVNAQSVTVHGAVQGELVAQDGIRLGSEARVEGNLTCRTLAIEEGAYFVGRSVMSDRG